MTEHVVRPVNSMGMNALLYFLCYEMSFLLRQNAMQDAIMVDKDSYESVVSDAGRNIIDRERKSKIVYVYTCENESLPHPRWKGLM